MMTRRAFLGTSLGLVTTAGLVAASRKGLAAGRDVTLSFLTYESLPSTKKVLLAQFAEFEKLHPGVRINPLFTSPEAVRKQVSSLLQSGASPGVVNLDLEDAMLYSHANVLEPVTDVVKRIGSVPGQWRAIVRGEDFFVPNDVKFTYTWYRSDLFAKHDLQPPTTWSDFRKVAAKLTQEGQYGYVVVSNETGDEPVSMLFSYAFSNGVTFLDDDGNILFDHGENKDALSETLAFFKEMSKYSPPASNFQWGDVISAFSSGRVAMADYIGARLYDVVLLNNPRLAPYTKSMVQPYGRARANRSSIEGYMIFKGVQDLSLAKELILYLHTGRRYLEYLWSIPLHALPPDRTTFEGPYQNNAFVKSHLDIVKTIRESWGYAHNPVYDLSGKKASYPRARIYTSTVYNRMIARVIDGGVSPERSIEQAAAEARALLR